MLRCGSGNDSLTALSPLVNDSLKAVARLALALALDQHVLATALDEDLLVLALHLLEGPLRHRLEGCRCPWPCGSSCRTLGTCCGKLSSCHRRNATSWRPADPRRRDVTLASRGAPPNGCGCEATWLSIHFTNKSKMELLSELDVKCGHLSMLQSPP